MARAPLPNTTTYSRPPAIEMFFKKWIIWFCAISGGAAQSWQMDNRWHTMVKGEFDFGFAIDWMRKDLGLAIEEARNLGASVPTTALIDQF